MSSGKLTAGPWRWLNEAALCADYGSRRAVLAASPVRVGDEIVGAEFRQCDERGRLVRLDAQSADARLLAAAPDLLEAVERLMRIPNVLVIRDAYERGQPERADIDFALDALAKVQP